MHSRLQVFDKDGSFIRGWFIPISSGSHALSIDHDDNINVDTSFGEGATYIYNSDGILQRTDKNVDNEQKLNKDDILSAKDKFGNRYYADIAVYE